MNHDWRYSTMGPPQPMMGPQQMKLYQNTGYQYSRRKQIVLTLSFNSSFEAGKDEADKADGNQLKHGKRVELTEPIVIDADSEIYLDNFTTKNIGDANINTNSHKHGFVMKIDEFDIKSYSNNPILQDAIVIPNLATNASAQTVHKGKKMNYISSINPKTISELNITLTDMTPQPSSPGGIIKNREDSGSSSDISFEFVIISKAHEKDKYEARANTQPQ